MIKLSRRELRKYSMTPEDAYAASVRRSMIVLSLLVFVFCAIIIVGCASDLTRKRGGATDWITSVACATPVLFLGIEQFFAVWRRSQAATVMVARVSTVFMISLPIAALIVVVLYPAFICAAFPVIPLTAGCWLNVKYANRWRRVLAKEENSW